MTGQGAADEQGLVVGVGEDGVETGGECGGAFQGGAYGS